MLGAAHDRDSVNQQRSATRGNDVLDGNSSTLFQRSEVGHIPHGDDTLLPPELLVENRRVQNVVSRIRIQFPEPLIACIGLARLRNRSSHYCAENRPHGTRCDWIADQDLPLPFWIEKIVPVLWGVGVLHRIAVVAYNLGCQVSAVPVVVDLASVG